MKCVTFARPLVSSLAIALALSACSTFSTNREPSPTWVSGDVNAPSDRVVREMVVSSLERLGFVVGTGMNPVEREVTTGWKTSLSPFKGEGTRKQAVVRYELDEDGAYQFDVRVRNQRNDELARPLDPRYADWKWTDDDAATAKVLLYHIRSSFAPQIEIEEGDPLDVWKEKHEADQ